MRKIVSIIVTVGFIVSPAAFASEASRIREHIMALGEKFPAIAPGFDDQARDLTDDFRFDNLAAMDAAGLKIATLQERPWSGPYWPTYAGQLANRYADPHYEFSTSWRDNAAYLESMLGKGNDSELSPAEKYDLLLGDEQFTLSRRMLSAGESHADRNGNVPTWFGLCHGWAAAAFMLPRPLRSVETVAPDGRKIIFTPTDLKALATLLWANGIRKTRFIGKRCERSEPNRRDEECFDTNPATWHMAVVNQIAVANRSFIMDVAAGREVWNHPVSGYHYSYRNPLTHEVAATLRKAKVAIADYGDDKYADRRDPATAYIVKVEMLVEYGVETAPSTAGSESAADDAQTTAVFEYDLELDRNDKILGGEWQSDFHPDFLWAPVKDSAAGSPGDSLLNRANDFRRWSGKQELWLAWRKAALKSSAAALPLARIVERLFELSRE